MSDYQFPPSSPLVGEREHNVKYDPFATKPKLGLDHSDVQSINNAVDEYPTPNPSSTIGRSSSPVRQPVGIQRPKKVAFDLNQNINHKAILPTKLEFNKKTSVSPVKISRKANGKISRSVRINKDFNILDPDSNVLRVPLNNDRTILVGRSSKSCDYHFKTADKSISRTHLAITSNSESNTITIECLGFSGFGMRIPKPCRVYGSDSTNEYVLMISEGNPLRFKDFRHLGLKVTPRTINLDSEHTEFFVNRKERVTVPKVNNIFIQVRENVILINPTEDEEEETDNELPVLIDRNEPQKKAVIQKEEEITEIKPQIQLHKAVENEATTTPHSTPVKQLYSSSTPITPLKPTMQDIRAASEEPTPSVSYKNLPTSSVFDSPQRKPLGDITNLKRGHEDATSKQQRKKKKHERSLSIEEAHLEITSTAHQQLQLLQDKSSTVTTEGPKDPVTLDSIPKLTEVNNVLLNHLAFSRLSSTPASFLITISALTSKLSLEHIRLVLANLKSVGVIYREGKDAAGKPLEEEYYYIPEEDNDIERTQLVASIKGHGGLRSCRRTHKQYYWKKPAPIKK